MTEAGRPSLKQQNEAILYVVQILSAQITASKSNADVNVNVNVNVDARVTSAPTSSSTSNPNTNVGGDE